MLFLCGHYAFPSAANSICVQNIAEHMVSCSHEVFVLAKGFEYHGEEETINGVKVLKYQGDSFGAVLEYFENKKGFFNLFLFYLFQFIRYLIIMWFYPQTSPQDTPKLLQRSKKLIEEENIDVVIATYKPYETIKVAIDLKREYREKIKVITYHLDLLTNPNNKLSLIVNYKRYKTHKAIFNEIEFVDKIFIPSTAPQINSKKVDYVDFPLYIPEILNKADTSTNNWFKSDTINISIVGTLSKSNRDPTYFFSLIEKLPLINEKKVILHVWGKLSDITIEGFPSIIYHGIASINEVPGILSGSDFLLNIGNSVTYRMIPSKIFQFFATKKPIIFCISSSEDRSKPYFEKYGYTCFVEVNKNDIDNDICSLITFIKDNYKRTIEVDDKLFEKSTPAYICDRILNY